MKTRICSIIVLLFAVVPIAVYSQIDSVRFENGHLIIGEMISMNEGVLIMETDYSDEDFQIEWKKVVWVRSQSHFQINLRDGSQHFSTITSLNDSISKIYTDNNTPIICRTQDVVYLNAFEDRFKDRFDASIDVGLDIAKAKNLRTFTTRSYVGYKADKWSADGTINRLQTTQDSTEKIQRSDGSINYRFVITGRLYSIATVSFLSNTEQKLDLRSNAQLGMGLFLIRTNSAYWGGKLGANRNIERYSNKTEDRDTWEVYFGTELNLYDIGDFSLTTDIMTYLGVTEKKRFRLDGGISLKYDLPLDFYIRLGMSANYDNQPAQDASELDYVLQLGFGWEW